jgi:signal transduction histidine kinase
MLEALARQVASQLELRRLLLEHERIEASKDEFLAIASHELRSPLTSIHGSLRLLQSGGIGELEPDGWELLRIAGSNSERLIRLIDDMLDLHKIEAGGARLALAEVAPEALVRRAAEDARGIAEPAAVALEVVSGTRRRLRGDPDRLQQVLTNLLSNAVRHSPRGASITIETRDREDRVRISVHDRGPGIARHDLSRIFGKFEQVGSSRSAATRGTGLGLAISKAIVEQHGGAIGVESAPDAGSTFWFEIPAWDAAGSRTAFSMHPFSGGSPAT